MLRTLSLLSFLLSTLHGSNAQNTSTLPDVLDAETIASLGNNSLFTRWRPISHFSAPAGWMNVRSRTDSTGFGIYVDDGNNTHTEVPEFISWVGTANVFPERPLNSSSQLVFDTAEQTNNYTWWPGR
ncbi:hypothetical protein PMIN02_012789 [Paraphaeosphaeria minitans]|uniref:Uncharacterized protein n=1 Tax=Paraphaeosphaeria minitans TaxID=565426 RepID=A0A9P6KLZ7_9PLEO|nr:hypothetical protein PMIN01_10412 [Paraphaeosphaeria minitans]